MRWLGFFLLLLAVGVGVLFWIQNSSRTTDLTLDLGLVKVGLEHRISIPNLAALCFGSGFVSGAVLVGIRSLRQASRIRRLEQEQAITSAITGKAEPGSW